MLKWIRYFCPVALATLTLAQTAMAQDASSCGDIKNAYGPYDYTNAAHREEYLPIVEEFHFDAGVENLRGRIGVEFSEATVGGDIGYTLRAFPNHHRALYAMVRYNLESVPRGAKKMRYSVECWFNRAKRFAPHDAVVVMLEGLYYQRVSRYEEAKATYAQALAMAPESPEVNYNAALLYTELEEYDLAVKHALLAYELGYPLPGLRNKLKRLGKWPDQS